MPIDPSIPLQAQPTTRVQSPAELMGIVLAIQRGQQQQKTAELEAQKTDLELREKKRSMVAEDALNAAMSNALRKDGTIDLDRLGQAVIGTPAAIKFPSVAKAVGEMEEQQGKVLKARQEAAKLEADYIGSLATAADASEDPSDKAAVLAASLSSAVRRGLAKMEEVAPILDALLNDDGTPDPTKVKPVISRLQSAAAEQRELFSKEATSGAAALNADVNKQTFDIEKGGKEADTTVKMAVAAGMSKEGLTPDQQRQASQAAAQLQLSRQTEARMASQAAAQLQLEKQKEARLEKTEKAATPAERTSLAFYNRAKDALETITEGKDKSLEQKMAKQSLIGQERLQYAPNVLQTSEQRRYRQAQRAFTEARLRKESGAAIPAGEYENDAKTYFMQPGDDAATVKQKHDARETVLNGLKFSAGKAFDEYYGASNEPNAPKRKRFNPATGKAK